MAEESVEQQQVPAEAMEQAPAEDPPVDGEEPPAPPRSRATEAPKKPWRLKIFLCILLLDGIVSVVLLSPLVPGISDLESAITDHFTVYGTLLDLSILGGLRVFLSLVALVCSYFSAVPPPESPFELVHPMTGERKTREELEQEALEERLWPWFKRFVSRSAFGCELVAVIAQVWAVVKCLARMNIELGTYDDAKPMHPIFWLAIFATTLLSVVEASWLESMTKLAGQIGRYRRRRALATSESQASLQEPLLSEDPETPPVDDKDVRGVSDITADSDYKTTWSDLLSLLCRDVHLLFLAFCFLILAALAQVYIPKFTGNILDALATTFDNEDDDPSHESILDVPGFVENVYKLVIAAILGGVFSGIRGSIFTLVGGRVVVRLRLQLMDSLLTQDIGFFDVTRTGDITSRLSSDTTLVGDQVSLNVNVFLRSLVQAIGVLIFMFMVSWQLSILAFISVPLITTMSRWYGSFLSSLTRLMQKKLADGNSVCEAALSSMPTVRAFDAAEGELSEFETFMKQYLGLNVRCAVVYIGYATFVTALPQLVTAVVLFYGGLLVRNGDMTSGELVSFLLYLSSLSDAFASIGYIFSSMTQAVGAAGKVFELIHRKPRIKSPSDAGTPHAAHEGIRGMDANKTQLQRHAGIEPPMCEGRISLENVEMFYPARPKRRILNGLTLDVPPGSVVALVGQSGGGKSSVMSLVQHLYEQSNGKVMIDGVEVHELSPQWLARHVSVVSQEPTLFARSVKRNIMYGLEGTEYEPTQEEIEHAARLANADTFIQNMPFGYDTEVGERGVQLSGGQKQRIAIARALVRKPRILLLDEATSALDTESEHAVQSAIDKMIADGRGNDGQPGMTVVIVAHRLSTVKNADIIFVVQEGKIVEQGRHAELKGKEDGHYSKLIKRQMEAQTKLQNGTAQGAEEG